VRANHGVSRPAVLALLCLTACGSGEPGEIIRTPDERFEHLPGFDFEPRYMEIAGLRIHYVDEGPANGLPVLLLHGEPTWSYLYRKMIPPITAGGHRAIAPDLVGFGRSDKYVRMEDYSYRMQVDVMAEFVRRLDLQRATLFGQDWGGLVGLRVVAGDPDRFAGVIAANTGLPLPTAETSIPLAFSAWRLFSRWTPVFPTGRIIDAGTLTELPDDVRAAYEAPFPTRRHMAGARIMPSLVPIRPDDPAVPDTERAWEVLRRWNKPFVTAFSDGDPITRGLETIFQAQVPGARGRRHVTIEGAGHFLQEDKGEELGALVAEFVQRIERDLEPSAPGNGSDARSRTE
jgi:haloalkane dehalogenase